jgi:signal transduction histidine kinase
VVGGLLELLPLACQEPVAADLPVRLRTALAEMDVEFIADEIPEALSQSLEGLDRVAQIVRAMKDFSHPGSGRSECDVNRAVESTTQVSSSEWKHVAELTLDLDPEVGLVPCYEGELKQVLLNLIVNAAQAIGQPLTSGGGGPLGHIQATTRRDRDVIRITISDDGPGMSPETKLRVFDPFFTTKAVGQGTGQGLSIAHAIIVNKHGGTIQVESAPGAGAVFELTLPVRVDDPPAPDGA